MTTEIPTIADVVKAKHLIRAHLYPTPARRSTALSHQFSAEIYLKPENLQRTGSFKIRGAINRVAELASAGGNAVITASAGNHGQGVGLAAGLFDMSATVVVPENASSAKIAALSRMNVGLHLAGRSFDDAQRAMIAMARDGAIPIVSPYDAAVIAGQGTAAYEFVDEIPDLDLLLVPVGAGGLLAGSLIAAKSMNPGIQVIGVQAAASPSMVAALNAGRIVDTPIESTIADGLEGNIEGGELPFGIIQRMVDDVLLVEEASIASAMRLFAAEERLIVEGAAAVGLALLLEGRIDVAGKRVGLMISGGNVSFETLRSLICA